MMTVRQADERGTGVLESLSCTTLVAASFFSLYMHVSGVLGKVLPSKDLWTECDVSRCNSNSLCASFVHYVENELQWELILFDSYVAFCF
jgi:hypothetical protein